MHALTTRGDLLAPARTCQALSRLGLRSLVAGLIFGIYVLAIPQLVLASLGACIAVFSFCCLRRPVHRIGMLLLLNFGWWIVSGTLSGGLVADSLVQPEFWRGEGRCFLFYLPLLAFAVLSVRESELRYIVKMLCVLTLVGAALCGLWLIGLGHWFQLRHGEEGPTTYFIGLQTSHTGAGAFWGVMAAFLGAFSLHSKQWIIRGLAVVAVALTLATGGRAATLGLVAVAAWLAIQTARSHRNALNWIAPAGLVILAAAWCLLTLLPQVADRMAEVFEPRTHRALVAALDEPTLEDANGTFYSGANLPNHNLVIRIFLWKYATHLFRQSPWLGIGFGRFNDTQLEFSGVPHVFQFAHRGEISLGAGIRWEEGQRMSATGNAHNSYLHVLAETGAVGLVLLLALWWSMYAECRVSSSQGQFAVAYGLGCRAAMICLAVAALFGHALAAPSGGILITTLVGARLALRS